MVSTVTVVGRPVAYGIGFVGTAPGRGKAWSVLWVSLVLLLAALFQAQNALAVVVCGLVLVGVGWAAVAGGPWCRRRSRSGWCGCCSSAAPRRPSVSAGATAATPTDWPAER
ncbi:hypothetical protein [Pseudonocardia sp. H11422]|uniref:hypothetical protein n=1 Tax=Pseudonocardia sp. H11422 TaxID=2835866 RepID=UPI001BDBE043|nr:hypothetical protein [Pseudonocardia sp. H11422]